MIIYLLQKHALGRSSSVYLGLGFVHQILNRSCEKDIFTVRQCTGETVRAYAERYQTAIALLASETEPLDGLLNIHRKQWTHGLHAGHASTCYGSKPTYVRSMS